MSEPWPDDYRPKMSPVLAALDFAPGCEVTRSGVRCQGVAAVWIRWHPPNRCTHPSLDGGCWSKLVCIPCLEAYEAKAAHVVKTMRPRWWRLTDPKCETCSMPVQLTTDIIQTTWWLKEGLR